MIPYQSEDFFDVFDHTFSGDISELLQEADSYNNPEDTLSHELHTYTHEDRRVPKRYSSDDDFIPETGYYLQDGEDFAAHVCVSPDDVYLSESADDAFNNSSESKASEVSVSSSSPAYFLSHDHSYSIIPKQSDDENLHSSSDSSSEELPPSIPASRRNTQSLNPQNGPKKIKRGQTAIFKSQRVCVQRTRTVRSCRQPKKGSSIPSNSHNYLGREDFLKRKEHNTSERQRRDAQRTALQNLRLCIPELVKNQKAAKVHILNSATTYIRELKQEDEVLTTDKQKEEKKNRALQRKLKKLLKSSNPEMYKKNFEGIMRKISVV